MFANWYQNNWSLVAHIRFNRIPHTQEVRPALNYRLWILEVYSCWSIKGASDNLKRPSLIWPPSGLQCPIAVYFLDRKITERKCNQQMVAPSCQYTSWQPIFKRWRVELFYTFSTSSESSLLLTPQHVLLSHSPLNHEYSPSCIVLPLRYLRIWSNTQGRHQARRRSMWCTHYMRRAALLFESEWENSPMREEAMPRTRRMPHRAVLQQARLLRRTEMCFR